VLDIENRTIVETAAIFSLVPPSHLPLIATGMRCKDFESGDEFICLGYAKSDEVNEYRKTLSMVP
jgi:hypothetical protein